MSTAIRQTIYFIREFVALCLLLASVSATVIILAAMLGG